MFGLPGLAVCGQASLEMLGSCQPRAHEGSATASGLREATVPGRSDAEGLGGRSPVRRAAPVLAGP